MAEVAKHGAAGGAVRHAAVVPRRFGLIAIVAVGVLAADQLTKAWAVDALADRTIPLVWTLRLNLARNTGAAFSMGRGTDWGRFVPLLALVVVAVVIVAGRSVSSKLGAVAIGMIVGGAVGNLVDRALRTSGGGFFSGGVVDFIDFQWWPIFNVADMGVVVGGFLLVVVSLRAPAVDPDEDVVIRPGSVAGAGDGPVPPADHAEPGADRSPGGSEPDPVGPDRAPSDPPAS